MYILYNKIIYHLIIDIYDKIYSLNLTCAMQLQYWILEWSLPFVDFFDFFQTHLCGLLVPFLVFSLFFHIIFTVNTECIC